MSYGTSIKLTSDNDFYFDDYKRLTMVRGTDNLVQNVNIILNTFEGEHPIVVNFGTRLQDIIGKRVSDNFVKYTIKNAILKDPRIKSVQSISIVRTFTTITAKISVQTMDSEMVDIRSIIQWR